MIEAMDPVSEIKARLPIEDLVRGYCQLKKAGRSYRALCPFHHDEHPSLIVSPDKGIAYCFACQSGGDVFSFYQKIEGVDFPQALKDLAERVGIPLTDQGARQSKDQRERFRECLEAARRLYCERLRAAEYVQQYLRKRGVSPEEEAQYALGYAPDAPHDMYDLLLKEGFSRSEILAVGLGVQRELREEHVYDRFRKRLMFPIADHQGRIVGFGGRILGDGEPKYLNSSDGSLYRKSAVLYGLHLAREVMRREKAVILVEGYFDVLACRRIGIEHVVASCGTALTEEHVTILRRSVETVILCLDQDRAGKDAAERAFCLLSREGLHVRGVTLSLKDPADMVQEDPDGFSLALRSGGRPYMQCVYDEVRAQDLRDPLVRRRALHRLLPLLASIPSAVERTQELRDAAEALGTTPSALEEDLRALRGTPRAQEDRQMERGVQQFTSMDITLGLFLLYPHCRSCLSELIPPPEEGRARVLSTALRALPEGQAGTIEDLPIAEEVREWVKILLLYCEQHGLCDWSEMVALREIRRNCMVANRETIRRKQQEIGQKLLEARQRGGEDEEKLLQVQYHEVLKLAKMAA